MIVKYKIYKEININDYLLSYYVSKSNIYKLFNEKRIFVNDIEAKNNIILKPNDVLKINYDEKIDYAPLDYNLDILYEDDYFLIINKNPKIIIHDDYNSLANAVSKYYIDNKIFLSIKFSNRLDFDTSGIIIFNKDLLTHTYMNHIIENHDIKKEYRCIVCGHMKYKSDNINLNIAKDRHNSNKMVISKNGIKAQSKYKVLKEYDNYSYLSVKIKTGKKHQIRCHLSYLGNPVVGDDLYGAKLKEDRVMLHSYKIEFIHPVNGELIEIVAPLPIDFDKYLI